MSTCPARVAARTILVGPSWSLFSKATPRARSSARIIWPSKAPSVSILDATTTAPSRACAGEPIKATVKISAATEASEHTRSYPALQMALAADGHCGNASHTRLVHLMTENDVATTMVEDLDYTRARGARRQTCHSGDVAFCRIRDRADGRRVERSRYPGGLSGHYARRYYRVCRLCTRFPEF